MAFENFGTEILSGFSVRNILDSSKISVFISRSLSLLLTPQRDYITFDWEFSKIQKKPWTICRHLSTYMLWTNYLKRYVLVASGRQFNWHVFQEGWGVSLSVIRKQPENRRYVRLIVHVYLFHTRTTFAIYKSSKHNTCSDAKYLNNNSSTTMIFFTIVFKFGIILENPGLSNSFKADTHNTYVSLPFFRFTI